MDGTLKPIIAMLEERLRGALEIATGRKDCQPLVRLAGDARFGDYQANGVMPLAKELGRPPRDLAQRVVEALRVEDLCEPPEVAGPGFINLRLRPEFLARRLLDVAADPDRLGVDPTERPQNVVVDFSSPNIAKEMHVGHLRSTIIGDAICRVLDFQGHHVIRQNHIGDWGTQFGRVILGLWHVCMAEKHAADESGGLYFERELPALRECAHDTSRLEALCKAIRERHEKDWRTDSKVEEGDGEIVFKPFLESLSARPDETLWPSIQLGYQYVTTLEDLVTGMGLTVPTRQAGVIPYEDIGRHATAMLQNHENSKNQQEYSAWERVRRLTMHCCYQVYDRLGVTLRPEDERGESAYQPMLPQVVEDLKAAGLAVESEGAICVFPEGFKNKQGDPLPFIIRKSDGAYLYATTDLAAIRYRVDELHADRIIYVTDFRQAQHFAMLFATARMAGWAPAGVELQHITFGTMLGENGRPFKTRSGGTVKLAELLDEAVERAMAIVQEKNPDLPDDGKRHIAEAVGVGAVKYADYSTNRESDYVFSFDRMLAMEGNTAPYMQYAYARIKSIERKAAGRDVDIQSELAGLDAVTLTDPAEVDLAKHLIRYGEAVAATAKEWRLNLLTQYLYDLAQKFSAFYTNCPVLGAAAGQRGGRLLLCDLTARTIRHGLKDLLGIAVVEQM
ncbi:MAG TPA: arginine--tRNA ligase [Phycisphaerales bacterium]|nr:arginine--tRNA ligase [Phycisphaerales bacterium]